MNLKSTNILLALIVFIMAAAFSFYIINLPPDEQTPSEAPNPTELIIETADQIPQDTALQTSEVAETTNKQAPQNNHETVNNAKQTEKPKPDQKTADPHAAVRESFESSITEMLELIEEGNPIAVGLRVFEPGTHLHKQLQKLASMDIPPQFYDAIKDQANRFSEKLKNLSWDTLEWDNDEVKIMLPNGVGSTNPEIEGRLYQVDGTWFIKPIIN